MDSHSRQSVVWSFDACTAEFGTVNSLVITLKTDQVVEASGTTHFTVALGRLTGASVARWQNAKVIYGGEEWSYKLSLSTSTKEIRAEYSFTGRFVSQMPTKPTEYTDTAVLYFNDESVAQRVKSASYTLRISAEANGQNRFECCSARTGNDEIGKRGRGFDLAGRCGPTPPGWLLKQSGACQAL